MNNFFDLTSDKQRNVITQVSNKTGLPVQSIEKDLWVTVILQLLFSLSFAKHLVFKGGTSLSKVWHQIERFSEDIDIAVDRCLFGMEGDLTTKQIKKLRKKSSLFVQNEVCSELQDIIIKYGLGDKCIVTAEPNGDGDQTYPEPRKLHIGYTSLFTDKLDYLRSEVLLEIGSRSLIEPAQIAKVSTLISENTGINTTLVDSDIMTAEYGKTFLEKAFLLHELFSTEGCAFANRKSRHLYDLWAMWTKDYFINEMWDNDLWNTIHHHREVFTHMKNVDYTPDIRDRICLTPPSEYLSEWKKDYEAMKEVMIYGDSPSFDDLLSTMEDIGEMFKLHI